MLTKVKTNVEFQIVTLLNNTAYLKPNTSSLWQALFLYWAVIGWKISERLWFLLHCNNDYFDTFPRLLMSVKCFKLISKIPNKNPHNQNCFSFCYNTPLCVQSTTQCTFLLLVLGPPPLCMESLLYNYYRAPLIHNYGRKYWISSENYDVYFT